MDRTVIGIVGPMSSGKGELVKKLSALGYQPYSLSNILRKTIEELQLTPTRKNLQDIGDFLRGHAESGNAVLAERAASEILLSSHRKYAIESIRNPDEIKALRQIFNARIIGVDASREQRFKLMKIRARLGDPETWDEFIEAANRDLGIGQESNGQQVAACLKLADHIITNDGMLNEFEFKIEDLFSSMGIEGQKLTQEKR